jgi:transglutaminase 1
VGVGETAEHTFMFTPPYSGRATLVAKFTSKELDDVDGFLAFEVHPRDEDVIMNGDIAEIVARTDVIP